MTPIATLIFIFFSEVLFVLMTCLSSECKDQGANPIVANLTYFLSRSNRHMQRPAFSFSNIQHLFIELPCSFAQSEKLSSRLHLGHPRIKEVRLQVYASITKHDAASSTIPHCETTCVTTGDRHV